jgi:hypothetical protein
MNRITRRTLMAGAVLTVALVAPGVARADVIGDWNAIAQAETVLIRPTAHGQSRGMAMVQGAVYDAVNAIDHGHRPYLLEGSFQPFGSQDAAVATAAHDVLVEIVDPARVAALDTAYAATLAGIADGPIEDEGVEAGQAAAQVMLDARDGDGFLAAFSPTIGTDAGDWRPIGWPGAPVFDPDGWVGELEPFLIESPSQFLSNGPNALTSGVYTKDFDEVKELGSLTSTTRTAGQTTAAIFWQFPPIALWNRLARELSAPGRFGLDTADQARLYAMINLASVDGAIACWYEKYYWSFWRPRAAIREADTDGNPRTVADPNWESLFHPSMGAGLATPPFPDHPAGHGCVSGATLSTFREFFGTDKVAFDVHSGRFPGEPRHFDRFSQAIDEIVGARVWGGIHFRTAVVEGAAVGKKVAHWLRQNYFEPTR